MANSVKQLAGETVIYGFSSILARVLNFLFVPIYTRMLTTAQYGVVTEFMAYIAILQVVLVLGLETGCFRFANKPGEDPDKVYSNAVLAVFGLNLAFLAVIVTNCKRDALALIINADDQELTRHCLAGNERCDDLHAPDIGAQMLFLNDLKHYRSPP